MASATRSTLPLALARGTLEDSPTSRSIFAGLSQILGTHAVLAVSGIATLPVLARNFGPAKYGTFSIFLTLLGVLSTLDFTRRLFVRELATKPDADERAGLDSLGAATTWGLALFAFPAGLIVFETRTALGLTLALFFHALASRDFATLSYKGLVGRAGAVRNCAWAGATVAVACLSFVSSAEDVFVWPFAVANICVFLAYRSMVGRGTGASQWSLAFSRNPLAHAWRKHGPNARELVLFSLASCIMVATDRVWLERTANPVALGEYVANGDVALKLTLFGTALGNVLYPYYTRLIEGGGFERATRRFVQIASVVTCGYFVLVVTLMIFSEPILGLFLGEEYQGGNIFFVLVLVGIFLQSFGYMIQPWQRARGEFTVQRKAYGAAAVLMFVLAAALIPRYGAMGAVLAYLASRSAEMVLLVGEARSLPRAVLPTWKLGVAAAMILCVGATALWKTGVFA